MFLFLSGFVFYFFNLFYFIHSFYMFCPTIFTCHLICCLWNRNSVCFLHLSILVLSLNHHKNFIYDFISVACILDISLSYNIYSSHDQKLNLVPRLLVIFVIANLLLFCSFAIYSVHFLHGKSANFAVYKLNYTTMSGVDISTWYGKRPCHNPNRKRYDAVDIGYLSLLSQVKLIVCCQ